MIFIEHVFLLKKQLLVTILKQKVCPRDLLNGKDLCFYDYFYSYLVCVCVCVCVGHSEEGL